MKTHFPFQINESFRGTFIEISREDLFWLLGLLVILIYFLLFHVFWCMCQLSVLTFIALLPTLESHSFVSQLTGERFQQRALERHWTGKGLFILVLLLSLCFSRGRRPGDTRWRSPPGAWHFTMGCLPQHPRCAHFGKLLHSLVGQSSTIVNPIWISALSCFLDSFLPWAFCLSPRAHASSYSAISIVLGILLTPHCS